MDELLVRLKPERDYPLMLAVAAIALMRVQHEKQAAARWLCATAIDGSFSHALVETLGKVLASTA